ncbi:MAG: S24 family peptidase [Patescibacteria group bacterium]
MGFPTFEETGSNLLNLEQYLIENVHASFLTKMQNDNLEPISILKGDLIILERRSSVNADDIVLVMDEGHHIFLKAELNKGQIMLRSVADNAVHSNAVEVIGVIKGVVRKY